MRAVTAAALAGAVLALAGCSRGGADGSGSRSGSGSASSMIGDAVRHVPPNIGYVEFGDLAGMRKEMIGGPGHVVRLTARGNQTNILFTAMQSEDLSSLFPTSTAES